MISRAWANRFILKIMAVGFYAAAFFLGSCCRAEALTVKGIPSWLEPQVMRGLSAVWDEIPPAPGSSRVETLALVARRLFAGYEISAEQTGREPLVIFKALAPARWKALVIRPELRVPTDSWFARDASGMEEELSALLGGLPIEALTWADSTLRDSVAEMAERRLPGWDFSLLARLETEREEEGEDKGAGVGVEKVSSPTLQVTFHPRQPLILAVTPSIFSSTLPVMFQSSLSAKLMPGISPVIGLPVVWAEAHKDDIELLAQEFLEDRNTVSNTRSKVDVAFVPGQISKVDAAVNSERFIFQIWMSAYAGIDDRYPEFGLLAGWNTMEATGLDLEIYDEVIIDVSEFGFTNRLGARLKIFDDLQAGLEVEWPEREIWYRAWWGPARVRRPYAWWRYSPRLGHNAAIGYRINEYLSIELHYDERYEDKIGLKGILLM